MFHFSAGHFDPTHTWHSFLCILHIRTPLVHSRNTLSYASILSRINRNMGTFERSWNKAESNVSCFVLRAKCFQCLGSFFYCRPHIPVSKLVVSESYDTYISRSFQVTKEIISECKSKGRCYLGLRTWICDHFSITVSQLFRMAQHALSNSFNRKEKYV